MANFMNKFRCGRTTPQTTNHPFAEGADPPPSIAANQSNFLPSHTSSSAYHQSACSPKKPTSSPASKTSTSSPFSTPVMGKSAISSTPPLTTGEYRVSPTKTSKTPTAKPASALPPVLPAPSYALPPTPIASPDRRSSMLFVGTERTQHAKKPSLGLRSQGHAAPPSSFVSPILHKHARIGSELPHKPQSPSHSRSASSPCSTSPSKKPPIHRSNRCVFDSYNVSESMGSNIGQSVARPTEAEPFDYHEPRHRPAALRLRTSNLNLELAEKSKMRIKESPSIDLDYGGILVKSSALSPLIFENLPQSSFPPSSKEKSSTSIPDSASPEILITPASIFTSLSTAAFTKPSNHFKPFENLPIPWSTIATSDLYKELGEEKYNTFIDTNLSEIKRIDIKLLHPDIISISFSEEERLQIELNRLKEKHSLLVNQRESLIKRIEIGLLTIDQIQLHKLIQHLKQIDKRVDRISRQIYICNDQIKQIQIQSKEHIIGVLKIALAIKRKAVDNETLQHSRKNDHHELSIDERSLNSRSSDMISNCPTTLRADVPHTIAIRFLEPELSSSSPTSITKSKDEIKESSCQCSRPLSTATVINVNSFPFPIPPNRKKNSDEEGKPENKSTLFKSTTRSVRKTHISAKQDLRLPNSDDQCGLEVEIGQDLHDQDDFGSTDHHNTDISFIETCTDILIYPPGHVRSISAPLLGLEVPLSAYTLSTDHNFHNACDNDRFHERSISENDYHPSSSTSSCGSTIRVTAPLRINTKRRMKISE
ncbi:uncharacterized protein I206_105495 [Kwoniella pini CBS 10737]|uniref:Uncharacterized protein n=1 Tax=Kwoniella pini CBS 10737 TaxID=1296096 RepID=A0A1B9I432_9TREE|nr:uncharacterized protein I206_03602 [Kwoniella pini CBS 10737]OCF50283.1 hypothetical protein I206_03602 [Kwoniella pini CBS 10737]